MNSHIIFRNQIEQIEQKSLAPYAALSGESRGRVYPQLEHSLRTSFQRDRDRIVHSAAFRRMEYKTQVFIPHESDHFRTRLTHTIEVSQISRSMARNLGLNEDLAEAIALVHDLGHTPFGHAGEDALNDLLEDSGGFNHNRQSLRVVDILERRYPDHPGLNLTYEVREGIVKHETKVEIILPEFNPNEQPTLEASLVDIADEITYNAHDLDDGLSSGYISLNDLTILSSSGIIDIAMNDSEILSNQQRYALVRNLINATVSDVLNETSRLLAENKIDSLEKLRKCRIKLCTYSNVMRGKVLKVKNFLNQKLYRHPQLQAHSEHARSIITHLFRRFSKEPDLLPENYKARLDNEQKDLVITDYIAGMTDRYAESIYMKIEE